MRAHYPDTVLSYYLDGELSPGKHKEVKAHLKECWACTKYAAELSLTDELTRRLFYTQKCKRCQGTGRIENKEIGRKVGCRACRGTGGRI